MARACILVALLAVACTATVSSAVFTSTSGIGTWTDLFQYPSNAPKTITTASCNTDTSCYVASNSSLFSFNGVPNGTFTPLKTPYYPDQITALVVSGPIDAPGGAVVHGDYDAPIFYPVNKMTFEPSKAKAPKDAISSLDARASANGREVLVINGDELNVLYSSNGGKDFIVKTINVALAGNSTRPRFGHMVDKNTWYVTMGSYVNRRPYTAQIVKTTDGGNTWTTQFSKVGSLVFNAIECLSATHCVAVAEVDDGDHYGVYIYRTVDGESWDKVFFGYDTYLTYLRANAHGHFFAAGWKSEEAPFVNYLGSFAYILSSVDGGATWVATWDQASPIPNVQMITGLSFTPGGVGFATATRYRVGDTTILRYDPAPSQLPH